MKQEARLAFVRHVRHPDRAEMRRDPCRAESNEVEFGKSCKLRRHASERGATGVETGFDFGPIVDRNLAGLVKGFATCKFLSVPRRGNENERT